LKEKTPKEKKQPVMERISGTGGC